LDRTVLDKDIKYLNNNGNLFRTRAEYSFSKILEFLGKDYEYDVQLETQNSKNVNVDFKLGDRYVEIIDSKADFDKFDLIKKSVPELKICGFGHSKYAAKVSELDIPFYYDWGDGIERSSIFIEDPSLAFDYAHILPLVEKCSILHGHTSTVMVEIIGRMNNNIVVDFGRAKEIIKETLSAIDHKFFISRKYLRKEDDFHYFISFEGPNGHFNLQLPKQTTFLLFGEATVETLSTEIIKLLAPKMPPNIEALGVYIYEGVNKGAHMIAEIGGE
jgi:6-pyruvoyltetrahydropterin/6-carboxytetrahydropterin synthase